jgi:SAM-dependent methyltransferase
MQASQATSETRLFWEARADLWAALADDADSFYARRTRVVVNLLRQFVPKGAVLDVGCGVGLLVAELLSSGYDAYGTDLADSMVQRARERTPAPRPEIASRFRTCLSSRLPFSQQFDAVTAIGVFPYVRDWARFLELLSRRLAPGGILVASCINRRGLYTFILLFQQLIRFRRTPGWRSVCRNLWSTGLWSGGFLDGPLGRQCTDPRAFERLLLERGYSVLAGVDLYHLGRWLDVSPQHRGFIGRRLARRAGWTHLVVARKDGAG